MRLTIDNGSFAYHAAERQILRDIGCHVQSGEILAILGPNGAGKTTLLRCTLGLLRWQSGCTLLDGEDIRRIPRRTLWQRIAYVPQAAAAQAPYTAGEMTLLGRSSRMGAFSSPTRADRAAAESVMERLGIARLRDKRFSKLSGGEKQMVLIARALAAEPQLLVLDEPESNLDFRNQLLVLDTMSALAADGMACIFNTHYPAHALRRAHSALMLSRSGAFRFGPTHEIVTEKSIGEFFGVSAVIGGIETRGNVYQDVIPVGLRGEGCEPRDESLRAAATLSIIMPDRKNAMRVNEIIHSVSPWIMGRMGMPLTPAGLYIINLVLDAPSRELARVTAELNLLPGVSVKATYAREDAGIG